MRILISSTSTCTAGLETRLELECQSCIRPHVDTPGEWARPTRTNRPSSAFSDRFTAHHAWVPREQATRGAELRPKKLSPRNEKILTPTPFRYTIVSTPK